MKRSRAILICLLFSVSVLSCLTAREPASTDWPSQTETVRQFTVKSDDGDYRLEVTLTQPKKLVEKVTKTKTSREVRYEFNGRLLPKTFSPGENLLTSFRLFHNDKEISVHPKYWKDVTGLMIQKSKVDSKTVPEDRQDEFFAFLDSLPQPRIYPSEQGESILVEWEISGEGGSKTSYRWIIEPGGKTLFHCFMPLVGC